MNRPIKVAYVIGGLPFGGVENWLLDLVLALRQGNDIIPYVLNLSGTGNLMPKFAAMGIDVICIGNDKKAINTHKLSTVLALRSKLRQIDPDVIHTLHFSGDYFGRLASLGLGKPVFTHLRNTKSERKGFRRIANKLLSYATTCYFSVSGQVAETVRKDHNVAGRPSYILYNAVDPKKLLVDPIDLGERYGLKGRVIIGVGRFVAQKNFDKLIKAFAILKESVQDVSLLLLGDGDQMAALKDLVGGLNLQGDVCMPGYTNNEDIPGHLKSSYLLAMPSQYEGLPITHVEALFCGLPAVISEHVPSLEIASEASLVCRTEVDDIADKLLTILNDPALHKQLSEAALAIAPRYSIGNYVTELVDYYSKFL